MPGHNPPVLNGHKSVSHDRLTDTVNQHVANTLRTVALGERITWEAAFQLFPGPQGPQPVVAIYLQTPSPLIGQALIEVVLIEAPRVSGEAVAAGVTEAVGRMFAARAQSTSLASVG